MTNTDVKYLTVQSINTRLSRQSELKLNILAALVMLALTVLVCILVAVVLSHMVITVNAPDGLSYIAWNIN